MQRICGIDEAGRGPLAGPVTAAAVILPPGFDTTILNDSKKLSESARIHARRALCKSGAKIGIGWAWPEEIDRHNIHAATLLAMRRAYYELVSQPHPLPDRVLVDGKYVPVLERAPGALEPSIEPIIGGDGLICEIMAASIIAKVSRDSWMRRYSWIEPAYGYDRHKGYPTKEHRRICLDIGPSPIQRRSFTVRES